MTEPRLIALFPLGLVLFPGAVIPLHIFEERYKLMINRCLESDGVFGVILIRQGWEVGPAAEPYDVGTFARIVKTERLDGGKLNLTLAGDGRFRLLRQVPGEPYLQAEVESLDEDASGVPERLVRLVRAQFETYVQTIRRQSRQHEGTVLLPGRPLDLSYAVAASLQISRTEQQLLLEESAADRIAHESQILRREALLLGRLGAVSTRRLRTPQEVPVN
jgi:Lon protease-like protein